MGKWMGLAAGSLAGGFARYFLATWVYGIAGTGFPYGTLLVNISGCFLIGLFDGLAEVRFLLGPDERILLMTGFCGAYTTFSTLILETSKLAGGGQWPRAAANFFGSGALGFLLFRLGAAVGGIR
ncbi:MAG: CrcB family protein [Elusimicrobia bacterium]|nr:CrcB family protein [Elusimicrobiota bacterium]